MPALATLVWLLIPCIPNNLTMQLHEVPPSRCWTPEDWAAHRLRQAARAAAAADGGAPARMRAADLAPVVATNPAAYADSLAPQVWVGGKRIGGGRACLAGWFAALPVATLTSAHVVCACPMLRPPIHRRCSLLTSRLPQVSVGPGVHDERPLSVKEKLEVNSAVG